MCVIVGKNWRIGISSSLVCCFSNSSRQEEEEEQQQQRETKFGEVGSKANFGGDIVVRIFFFSAIIVVFSTMIFSCFRNVQFLMFLMMEEDDGLLRGFPFLSVRFQVCTFRSISEVSEVLATLWLVEFSLLKMLFFSLFGFSAGSLVFRPFCC
jgi:hypothetical protein